MRCWFCKCKGAKPIHVRWPLLCDEYVYLCAAHARSRLVRWFFAVRNEKRLAVEE